MHLTRHLAGLYHCRNSITISLGGFWSAGKLEKMKQEFSQRLNERWEA